ncbi:craniofacial development protein 1 [Diaphorina citri]|uniref:Craniofacial development protein 1 n=1 Tax=Diaphorina citri TaxID=121845 RepID=A0A3Q0J821_DIACI|nr:craniofacial development protein 1 [Diaphorina citri]
MNEVLNLKIKRLLQWLHWMMHIYHLQMTVMKILYLQNEIEFLSSSTEFISGPTESPSDKKEESSSSMPEVKTVTQVCTFAGEQVKVEKQVPVSIVNSRGRGRGGRGGMAGILGALGKQPKLSILEKSKLDWTQYKQSEGLEEQLSTFNKGKDGYLEKQEFLQRTDLRQFENEKELRNATRKTLR